MPVEKTEKKSSADWAKDYHYALAFLKSEPEIWKLFQQAVSTGPKGSWTPEKFTAELRETKWFKTHNDTYRTNWEQMNSPDSATWDTRLTEFTERIRNSAAAGGAQLSDKELAKFAKDGLLYGWSDEIIANKLTGYIDTLGKTGHYGGEAGVNEDALRKYAMDYGQKISSGTLQNWVVKLARGDTTLQDFKASMSKMAEVKYAPYSEQIRKGMTVRDIADPYMQEMADTLELNVDNLDVFDPKIQAALTAQNADSNKQGELNKYDFSRTLREDPRWLRTKGAQDQTMNITRNLMKDWGFAT